MSHDSGMMVRSSASTTLAELEETLSYSSISNEVGNDLLASWPISIIRIKFLLINGKRSLCSLLKEHLETFGRSMLRIRFRELLIL